MVTQSIKIRLTVIALFFSTLSQAQTEESNNTPYVCLENILLTDQLDYLAQIGLSTYPTYREEDEAYGVDSIYYFRTDSLDATYLKEGNSVFLASIIPKCINCVSLSDGVALTLGQELYSISQQTNYLKNLLVHKLKKARFTKEDLLQILSLEIPVKNNGSFPHTQPYWLVNLSLKQGRITKIAILIQLE